MATWKNVCDMAIITTTLHKDVHQSTYTNLFILVICTILYMCHYIRIDNCTKIDTKQICVAIYADI